MQQQITGSLGKSCPTQYSNGRWWSALCLQEAHTQQVRTGPGGSPPPIWRRLPQKGYLFILGWVRPQDWINNSISFSCVLRFFRLIDYVSSDRTAWYVKWKANCAAVGESQFCLLMFHNAMTCRPITSLVSKATYRWQWVSYCEKHDACEIEGKLIYIW